jgi:hypothetical protein
MDATEYFVFDLANYYFGTTTARKWRKIPQLCARKELKREMGWWEEGVLNLAFVRCYRHSTKAVRSERRRKRAGRQLSTGGFRF